jgi:hypothetical protein
MFSSSFRAAPTRRRTNLIDGTADSANPHHNRERSPENVHLPRKICTHHLAEKPPFDYLVGSAVATEILKFQYLPRTVTPASPTAADPRRYGSLRWHRHT